jgi:exonuclease III
MKIVTWNCNGAFRKKHHALEQFDADVIVIQECEDPAQSTKAFLEWSGDYLWHGLNKNKCIGIFWREGITVERLGWDDDGLQLFLPCRINDEFNLVAVWTKHAGSPNFRYIGQLWKYMQLHKDKMAEDKLVLCGDLNSNVCWDEWDRWWNHSDVVRELEEIGVSSLYHSFFDEGQGDERKPTLFHQRNLDKPYHVDYVFSSGDLQASELSVGESKDWLEISDHMPLVGVFM